MERRANFVLLSITIVGLYSLFSLNTVVYQEPEKINRVEFIHAPPIEVEKTEFVKLDDFVRGNRLLDVDFAGLFNRKSKDYDIKPLLDTCSTTDSSRNMTSIFKKEGFTMQCQSPVSLKEFVCASNCPEREPELEEKMRYFSMQNYTLKMLKSYCDEKQISGLIWITDNVPKFLPCEDNRIRGRIIWSAFQSIVSLISCSIKLPNVIFAFDNGDYALPRGKQNWVRPTPGIVRYAGLPSHPTFLFPIREFITATTLPSLGGLSGTSLRTGLEISTKKECKTPFEDRENTMHWRGQLTGNFIRAGYMGFNPRLRLVEMFGNYKNESGHIYVDVGLKFPSRFAQANNSLVKKVAQYGQKAFLPNRKFCLYKYLMHVEGNSFAGSFAFRLSTGSLVLKVDSAFGFHEFYYDRIIPWRHYIPIHKNLDNLQEIIDFLETAEGKELTAKILQNVKNEVFDPKVGVLRPEANICYIVRLLYSLSLIQEVSPTEKALKKAGIKPKDFFFFPTYKNMQEEI